MPKKKKFSPALNKLEARGENEKKTKNKFIFAVGRRKRCVARVRLYEGKGENTLDGKAIGEVFPGEVAKVKYLKPFFLTGTLGKYFVTAKIEGGGRTGQLEALVHGVSRALSKANKEKYQPILKKAGFLRRDPREKERRKPGFAQKARKKKQSPKR